MIDCRPPTHLSSVRIKPMDARFGPKCWAAGLAHIHRPSTRRTNNTHKPIPAHNRISGDTSTDASDLLQCNVRVPLSIATNATHSPLSAMRKWHTYDYYRQLQSDTKTRICAMYTNRPQHHMKYCTVNTHTPTCSVINRKNVCVELCRNLFLNIVIANPHWGQM